MALKDAQPRAILLKDYKPPEFFIDKTELYISLREGQTEVTATLHIRRADKACGANSDLVLDGEALVLREIRLDDEPLDERAYQLRDDGLIIFSVPDTFRLTTRVVIEPEKNTTLEGLYKSSDMYCTQCEAEGFRKITYYLDRPDVLAEFTTTLEADKDRYPVLLSNGNPVASGEIDGNRHYVTWHDPFMKPAYLFAAVAGDLHCIEDSFTTCSGREIALRVYVRDGDSDKCRHAIGALKDAMAWDERVYGREYDLDIFMIVAVSDFNMGAMENKGLNIFNTSCVLAHPEITTDAAFQRVAAVVAHEYFHNWSGNRVTCRDWFQLSLKEGFTVFRDAEFSADMDSRTVKRVQDVNLLRTLQFAEDAGPTAHPVQPASYMEISNFYTLTVYEKGAEVVRMIHTLLGPETFRAGSDLYFNRFDGQAVTIEDFIACMSEVSGRDFTQFTRWYRQAGTPQLHVAGRYDAANKTFELDIEQSCPETPENKEKQPFLIPLRMGLVGQDGDLPLFVDGITDGEPELLLEITEKSHTFAFRQVEEPPIPSLLRGLSAPVKLHYSYQPHELKHLMTRDSDGFNRWEASNRLAVGVLRSLQENHLSREQLVLDDMIVEAFRTLLNETREDIDTDKAMVALMLNLPSENYLAEISEVIAVDAIHTARQFALRELGSSLGDMFLNTYEANRSVLPYQATGLQVGQRSLKNIALHYLMHGKAAQGLALARSQFQQATNMTDMSAALTSLVNSAVATREGAADDALDQFYKKWRSESLAVDLWLQIQACCALPGGLDRIKDLMNHEAFNIRNPNRVRALIGAFCSNNAINFHREDGAGYVFLAEVILELDQLNPQIAARLVTPLTKWRRFPSNYSEMMRAQLTHLVSQPALSKDVYEIVSKSLA